MLPVRFRILIGILNLLLDIVHPILETADALAQSGIFSGIHIRMLTVGFRTGATDAVMKQIAMQYDEEVENRMNSLVSRLEPTLVAILSIVVGMILLSVMLPLAGIMSNIG